MNDFKKIIETISSTSFYMGVKLSEYYTLLGYRDKHTFYRSLKNRKYEIGVKIEKIEERKGKEYYLNKNLLMDLLCEYFHDNQNWQSAYLDFKLSKYHDEIFKFTETKNKEYRFSLGILDKMKGVFYDYSLSTFKLSKEIGICPYQCYQIINQRFKPSYHFRNLDNKTGIPYICFDSLSANIRNRFLDFIDIVKQEFKLSKKQELDLIAYRMAIKEMLNYQQEIDEKAIKQKKDRESKAEKQLKEVYRQASLLYHPDVNKSPEAESFMKQINVFYEDKDYHSIVNLIKKSTRSV